MPLSGMFAQFIVICMNNRHRVEGDNERAAEEEFQCRQGGEEMGGWRGREGEREGQMHRRGCVAVMGVFR